MSNPLAGRHVVLGVTGSIAAYKALTLASRLSANGALVDVILTESAGRLVQPLAFQALTHRPVITSLWQPVGPMALDHVALARSADVLVVAPATAHSLARLALGLADDALTTTALASTAPLVLAPAMEPHMWSQPTTQAHVATLRERGALVVGPESGRTASGEEGVGRMVEPDCLLEHLRWLLGRRHGDLAGRRVLVTAGPTWEPIDPVRYLANRSSGRMGYALARCARDRGADVTLVSGPVAIPAPVGVTMVAVETALEMRSVVLERAAEMDAVIMAAAVSDYRPATVAGAKLKRRAAALGELRLVENPDILVDLAQTLRAAGAAGLPIRIGFAAETENLEANAAEKRREKELDLVVANPVPESFGDAGAAVTFVDAQAIRPLGWMPKESVAAAVLDWLRDALQDRTRADRLP